MFMIFQTQNRRVYFASHSMGMTHDCMDPLLMRNINNEKGDCSFVVPFEVYLLRSQVSYLDKACMLHNLNGNFSHR